MNSEMWQLGMRTCSAYVICDFLVQLSRRFLNLISRLVDLQFKMSGLTTDVW